MQIHIKFTLPSHTSSGPSQGSSHIQQQQQQVFREKMKKKHRGEKKRKQKEGKMWHVQEI